MGSKKPIHPNDHVNKSQSTNDVFQLQCILRLQLKQEKLYLLKLLEKELSKKPKSSKILLR